MVRNLLLGIAILLTISCESNHANFEGYWVDEESESDEILITKNGSNYIFENGNRKYPAQIKDELLEISTSTPTKATIDDNDVLIVRGREYIRIEKATRPRFFGRWKFSYYENPSTKEKEMFGAPEFLIIYKNKRGLLSIQYDGSPHFPQKYEDVRYKNGIIHYNLRYKSEISWERTNNKKFILVDDDKISTQQDFSPFNIILERVR
ncbi:hypothetical protein IMCC3317_24900 [Kordia antarctica]|uniref:Lipoprotein n=1 Tax=Kordia antarctica TaxID=1218801 RepID=A0A7L4ZKE7_9FLAO|nr:hypothetical protein [Kordia antarctica]QHI37112.1 hypothetical protein IMCC3317_24900 [Kordia antarctica]